MTTVTSTVYCEAPDCPGHRRTWEVDGRVVLTDDPARPLAVEPE